jgi:hypothetical protein
MRGGGRFWAEKNSPQAPTRVVAVRVHHSLATALDYKVRRDIPNSLHRPHSTFASRLHYSIIISLRLH